MECAQTNLQLLSEVWSHLESEQYFSEPFFFAVLRSLVKCCLRSLVDFFRSPRRFTAVSRRGLVFDLLPGIMPIHISIICGHTHDVKDRVQNNNNNNTIFGGSVLTGEEPPPHSGELKHALPQAGGPTQSQLSRPTSSGHHISMEHRLRRKQLNSDTNASNKKKYKKKEKETFSSEKMKKENEKH